MARILLVDDDEMFRNAVELGLIADKHQVVTAGNGVVAESLLRGGQPIDLVISDIRMPGMDGIQFMRSLRGYSQVPVILMTGFSEIAETIDAYELGANDFLAKPFKRLDLLDAVRRCLAPAGAAAEPKPELFKLSIDEFLTGRQIKFAIFVHLGSDRFVRVAHKGEDITIERARYYRDKGVNYLYVQQSDFRQYVGLGAAGGANQPLTAELLAKRAALLREAEEILEDQVRLDGLDANAFEAACAFVGASLYVLAEDARAIDMLDELRRHTDHLWLHSLGVSLYSVMLAQKVNWNLPTNRFKVAIGGLLHDVGHKQLLPTLTSRPRYTWSKQEVETFQSHPHYGHRRLNGLDFISEDVREICRQHHEDCRGRGYPSSLRRSAIHPMAKLVAVADEFCYRALPNPDSAGMSASDALLAMRRDCAEGLDKIFFEALIKLFAGRAQQSAAPQGTPA